MRKTYKCHNCHQIFRAEEIIEYASLNSKTSYRYCKNCYEQQKSRDEFSNKICEIFGIKRPDVKIWTQRKYLIDTYGYTDNIIIDCLDYVYNVEKFKKQKSTLGLVNPISVEKMIKYKSKKRLQLLGLFLRNKQKNILLMCVKIIKKMMRKI